MLLLLLFVSCQKSRVRGHTKGAGALGRSENPIEIKICPGNTTYLEQVKIYMAIYNLNASHVSRSV